MTSTQVAEFTGSCPVAGCTAGAGGPCLLGFEPIECDNFRPDPDQDVSQGDREDEAPAATGDAPLAGSPATEPPGTASVPIPAVLPGQPPVGADLEPKLTSVLDDPQELNDVDNRDCAEPTQPQGDVFESRVPIPEGPRGLVQFGEPSVPVHSGDALDDEQVGRLMAQTRVTVVVIAGPPWAGKTTLLASLYQQLVQAPIGEWTFAGSRSLRGFAVRSYWSDAASGVTSPTTARTSYDLSRPWLHLRLERNGRLHDLIIGDVSGEHFGPFRSGGPLGPIAPYLKRADHVVHLLDAAVLAQGRDRARALTASRALLRRFAENDAFDPRARHTMVISKVDACDPGIVDDAFTQAKGWLDRWLPGSATVRMSARPHTDEAPYGLADILDSVLAPVGQNPAQLPVRTLSRAARRLSARGARFYPLAEAQVDSDGAEAP